MKISVAVLLCMICTVATTKKETRSQTPYVKLGHGSQLKGKQTTFRGVKVNLFLGIPYAVPPIGSYRFEKPAKYPAWKGIRTATTMTPPCYQLRPGAAPVGDEDCLYLDITVPMTVQKGRPFQHKKKPVIVYIHGGAYRFGAKTWFLGAPLAVAGDVVMVTFNYRVGPFGFLSEGPGTGNFGLWDQNLALKWVKDNIAAFGGDPSSITIFGESAGAGSVSAHMLSEHSDGLFHRAIQMSGDLYTVWGWYLSDNQRDSFAAGVKLSVNCTDTSQSLYDCLRNLTATDILTNDVIFGNSLALHPVPDNNFFPANISEESYELSKRFDLLTGFNGQEGLQFIESIFHKGGPHYTNGTPPEFVTGIVSSACATVNPQSADTCLAFFKEHYDITTISDDMDRAVALSALYGDFAFVAPVERQLSRHSNNSKKSTYGYYFNQVLIEPKNVSRQNVPDWITLSAGHYDAIPYVFGGHYISQEYDHIVNAYTGGRQLTPDEQLNMEWYKGTSENFQQLNDILMTTFTNFAKSGNPNSPVALPIPQWPEFDSTQSLLMEFHGRLPNLTSVVTTPNKTRLTALQEVVMEAQRVQTLADSSSP
ncbi:NLGN2 [Bugula neritina]|uniref:Carboxylic ester hydrolase n=1 Tax=Bugula neritina TaxID=10212 RepID=A0A7J7IW78_BUGNE|nr:NLGN2 [Bugula neritina]